MLQLLKEIEEKYNVVNVRGGRGLGTGHPYPSKNYDKPTYGEQQNMKKEKYTLKPVKISKIFKKKGR